MTKKNRNLRAIAEDVLDLSLRETSPWMPTTSEIERTYKLNEMQTSRVKQYVKEYAASRGLIWAWDPTLERFRVCPNNAPKIAESMLGFAFDSWSAAGKSINQLVKGAEGQGYVTEKARKLAVRRNNRLTAAIQASFVKLEFSDAD